MALISDSNSESVELRRNIFWRNLSLEEREKVSVSADFRWVGLDQVSEVDLDPETLALVNEVLGTDRHGNVYIGREIRNCIA